MPDKTTATGLLVALHERSYNAFKARDGREVPGGITRLAYVVEAIDAEPYSVRVSDLAVWEFLHTQGFGASITFDCVLWPKVVNGQAVNDKQGVAARVADVPVHAESAPF